METLILKYDKKNKAIKKAIELVVALGASVEKTESRPALDKSLEDIKKGRVYTAKNVKDLMSKI